MKPLTLPMGLLVCSGFVLTAAPTTAQIHPHHAQQIRKAAAEVSPRVAPQKPRTVLIWNTPPHLMDEDPHKGYCIPYGEEGMKAIGEAGGAKRSSLTTKARRKSSARSAIPRNCSTS